MPNSIRKQKLPTDHLTVQLTKNAIKPSLSLPLPVFTLGASIGTSPVGVLNKSLRCIGVMIRLCIASGRQYNTGLVVAFGCYAVGKEEYGIEKIDKEEEEAEIFEAVFTPIVLSGAAIETGRAKRLLYVMPCPLGLEL